MKFFKLFLLIFLFLFCSCQPTTELPYGMINGNWVKRNSQDSSVTDHQFVFSSSNNSYTHTFQHTEGATKTFTGTYILKYISFQITQVSGEIFLDGKDSSKAESENTKYSFIITSSPNDGRQTLDLLDMEKREILSLVFNGV